MRLRDGVASLVLLLVLALLVLTPDRTAARSHADRSGISGDRSELAELDIGPITVRLGMTQEQTLSQFSGMHYKLEQPKPGVWLVSSGSVTGQVTFRDGVLVYAARDWLGPGRSDDELESVAAALVSLTQRGGPSCTLSSHPFSEPATTVQWVHISCGKRLLKLGVGRAQGSPVRALIESIGSP